MIVKNNTNWQMETNAGQRAEGDEIEGNTSQEGEVLSLSRYNNRKIYKYEFPFGNMGTTFILERRDNHDGMGYHSHIRMRNGGGYERAGYRLTRQGNTFYVEPHGRKLIDIRKCLSALTRDIRPYAKKELGKFLDSYMLRPSQDSIPFLI